MNKDKCFVSIALPFHGNHGNPIIINRVDESMVGKVMEWQSGVGAESINDSQTQTRRGRECDARRETVNAQSRSRHRFAERSPHTGKAGRRLDGRLHSEDGRAGPDGLQIRAADSWHNRPPPGKGTSRGTRHSSSWEVKAQHHKSRTVKRNMTTRVESRPLIPSSAKADHGTSWIVLPSPVCWSLAPSALTISMPTAQPAGCSLSASTSHRTFQLLTLETCRRSHAHPSSKRPSRSPIKYL